MIEKKWWHEKTAYQVYPKSFYDSNGDGIGDIPGIIEKLDYLKELGIDILWLSPIYLSPCADQGYDIADYYQIDPQFGTMEDVDRLLEEAKKRDICVLMDLVVNHCSDEHPWFLKACEDPDGEYGKFFYLEDKKDGELPTNWRSYFGGPVWDTLPGTDKYYLHVFHKKQPDLNWENPRLREEIYKMVNWWLEKGLAGFRIDAIINIKKPLPFKSYPADREDGLCDMGQVLADARGIREFLGEMRDRCFLPHSAFTVGEVFNAKSDELGDFIGENGYFSSMFDFAETVEGKSPLGWYASRIPSPDDYKNCCFKSQESVRDMGFLSNIIENHDEPRGVSHYLPQYAQNSKGKKLLASMYFMLKGLPFIYQGQELGMENSVYNSIDDIDDVGTKDEYRLCMEKGYEKEEALKIVGHYTRDNARTPFQWNGEANAGFSSGDPWLKVNPNYREINAESQIGKEDSVFSFYQKLIRLRKNPEYKETVVYGETCPVLAEQENLMAYFRRGEAQELLVLGNFANEEMRVSLPQLEGRELKVLLNNDENFKAQGGTVVLSPLQAVILEVR